MPAERATSSVLVPSKPCLANSATATRSTSPRRSSALIRTAGVITRYIVSDDSLPVKQIRSAAEALEQAVVGVGRLAVAVVGVGVVVAAVPLLPTGQYVAESDQPSGTAGGARGFTQREGELEVGVAVESRLRVRPAGGERDVPPHREEIAEQHVDVTRPGVTHRAPLVVDVDIGTAPAGTDDIGVAGDRVEQRRHGVTGQNRREVAPHVDLRDVRTEQRRASLPPADAAAAPGRRRVDVPHLEP